METKNRPSKQKLKTDSGIERKRKSGKIMIDAKHIIINNDFSFCYPTLYKQFKKKSEQFKRRFF